MRTHARGRRWFDGTDEERMRAMDEYCTRARGGEWPPFQWPYWAAEIDERRAITIKVKS